MKKMLSLFLCALLFLALTGCQNAPTDAGTAADLRPVQQFTDALFDTKMETDGVESYDVVASALAGRTGNTRVFCAEYTYTADGESDLHYGYILKFSDTQATGPRGRADDL
ncbi:MAG: hypothetical protein ACI4GO_00385 [Hominenteromicrobium sp.]